MRKITNNAFDLSQRRSSLLSTFANLLIPIAALVFATGFFPYKPFIPGRATFQDTNNGGQFASAPFDKLIFMVVDALRRLTFIQHQRQSITLKLSVTLFILLNQASSLLKRELITNCIHFQTLMLYCSLIRSGAAMPFTAHATSPTITMPRIKAITTGSIPSFLDVILNFAESDTTSNLASQDTWLAQLKNKRGGKLVMYGDDTWLKLFPDTFSRVDGTSSFFVSVSSGHSFKKCTLSNVRLRISC